jgi:hypothetical protein
VSIATAEADARRAAASGEQATCAAADGGRSCRGIADFIPAQCKALRRDDAGELLEDEEQTAVPAAG